MMPIPRSAQMFCGTSNSEDWRGGLYPNSAILEFSNSLMKLLNGHPGDTQLKSYRLGFLLLNAMREDFASKLFDDAPPEWKIRPPIPERKAETFLDRIPFLLSRQELPYFA
jgi:hypothetical protein